MRKVNDFLEGGGGKTEEHPWTAQTDLRRLLIIRMVSKQTTSNQNRLQHPASSVRFQLFLTFSEDFNTNCLCTIKTLWWCWNFSKKKLLLYVKGKYLFFEYRIAGCSVRAGYPGIRSMRLGDNFNWLEISLNSTNQ